MLNSRKFILAILIIVLQTVLFIFADLPAGTYQAIMISTIVGYMGTNAMQKLIQPKEMVITVPPEDQEADEYSPAEAVGFHT